MQVRVSGADLNVDIIGRGEAILLIHGLGADLNLWNDVVPQLSKKWQVIRYDLRGAGNSSSGSNQSLSMDLWVRDLESLIDHLGLEEFSLVGWSMGGMISIQFAANNPRRTKSMVLVGSTARLQPDALEFFRKRAELANTIGMSVLIERTFHLSLDAFAPLSRKDNPEIVGKYKKMLEKYDKDSYASACRALVSTDLTSKLTEIQTPTLIIVGQFDPRTPFTDSQAMCMTISNSWMKILPDCGHFYPLEQPERLSQEIHRFLTFVNATRSI